MYHRSMIMTACWLSYSQSTFEGHTPGIEVMLNWDPTQHTDVIRQHLNTDMMIDMTSEDCKGTPLGHAWL
jgi:hypothetical protein